MASDFDLVITADPANGTADLRLLDAHGGQLAFRQTDFGSFTVSRQRALFDLRDHLDHYVEPGDEAAKVAELGVLIAESVLGEAIFKALWTPESQRTLRIELPGATQTENRLAAALARVPWEMARPSATQPTLGERHLLVRVVHDRQAPVSRPLDLADGECLRVLFVFAEAPGSRPLAARLERQQLQQLFAQEIYPQRRIVADYLSHGVTREQLTDQIVGNGGYHIIHWSGHGHRNRLELARAGGGRDYLTGDQLLALCGGYLPHLVFLSACHSGDILRVRDWQSFLAVAKGQQAATKSLHGKDAKDAKDVDVAEQPGFTGTAHALLQRGVRSVVAMRYAVGDDYARDLGIAFYRALLAHPQPKSTAAALTLARQTLRDPHHPAARRYHPCDHATPVLYGAAHGLAALPPGRSPALDPRVRRLHRIAELTTAGHDHFVGRSGPLAGLGADFIGAPGKAARPVALITGLGGMGKTALAAEVLSLWEARFRWLLLYQAKPSPLGFEAFLRDVHLTLSGELGRYHQHVAGHPADAIFRPGDAGFSGAARLDRLARNLGQALREEAILLVLDNFETNLAPAPATGDASEPRWPCLEPAWDRCLALLAAELVGTGSRVLITCRRPLAALAATPHHRVQLGPLPAGEAALYVRTHPRLSQLTYGTDEAEAALAMRLLAASRFHPLLMDRLARLATGGPELRPQLLQALDALESSHDYQQLPALFSAGSESAELAYLEDALAASLDQLIADAVSEARRLLWMVAVANEPVSLGLLRDAWNEEERPDISPLLRHLVAVGLVTEARHDADDAHAELSCHELIRERIRASMAAHPEDHGTLSENVIRLAYADRLAAAFHALLHQNMTTALEAGSRALVYCVEAAAWERLAGFASRLVTSTHDPRLLAGLLPHLEAAADAAPAGEARWSCLCYLADALRNAGQPDAGLPFYQQAAEQARTAAEAGGDGERQAWSDLAWITGNWAPALRDTGELEAARQRLLESAEAERRAGRPAVYVIGRELEALRVDVLQGKAAAAGPEVARRLQKVEGWWQRHRAGRPVPEAPDSEFLARVLIGGLDIAKDVHRAQGHWERALRRTEAIIEVERALKRPAEEVARTRMNRGVALVKLGRLGEAQAELEACLEVFEDDPTRKARVLSSLAGLFAEQGDVDQAIDQQRRALAIFELLPDPRDRAISHYNLANYLECAGMAAGRAESARHQLAALVYLLVAGLGQDLQTPLHNYAVDFRRAEAAGVPLTVPAVAELLADPAFRPLAVWLGQRQVAIADLQAAVDQELEAARQMASQQG